MKTRIGLKKAGVGLAVAAAAGAAGYAALVVLNRSRYGKPHAASVRDSALDRFIPNPEVVEHHEIDINAPADVVLATARDMELLDSPVVRAIIRAREIVMGGEPDARPHPTKLVEQMQSIGWGVLSEHAGREIVMGAVTQPWETAPVFRTIPPEEFLNFAEPGYVKIV